MKNTLILKISLIILLSLTAISIAASEDYSYMAGQTCILPTGTEMVIDVGGTFAPVFVGATYAVKVGGVAQWDGDGVWYARVEFSVYLVRIIIPRNKLPNYMPIYEAAVDIRSLEGCK